MKERRQWSLKSLHRTVWMDAALRVTTLIQWPQNCPPHSSISRINDTVEIGHFLKGGLRTLRDHTIFKEEIRDRQRITLIQQRNEDTLATCNAQITVIPFWKEMTRITPHHHSSPFSHDSNGRDCFPCIRKMILSGSHPRGKRIPIVLPNVQRAG